MNEETETAKVLGEDHPANPQEDLPLSPKEEVKTPDLIDNANNAAERLEKANAQLDLLIAKQERMNVEHRLGGNTEAGSIGKSQDERDLEEAKAFLRGTGLEKDAFPDDQDVE